MATRNVVLTETQSALVDRLVASGRYQNASEALRAGLRLLEREEAELEQIRLEAIERFGLTSVQIAHRTGRLAVGESIVAIVCTAAHRAEAFDGCRYIIDELKKRASIWKKEIGENVERWVGQG